MSEIVACIEVSKGEVRGGGGGGEETKKWSGEARENRAQGGLELGTSLYVKRSKNVSIM